MSYRSRYIIYLSLGMGLQSLINALLIGFGFINGALLESILLIEIPLLGMFLVINRSYAMCLIFWGMSLQNIWGVAITYLGYPYLEVGEQFFSFLVYLLLIILVLISDFIWNIIFSDRR